MNSLPTPREKYSLLPLPGVSPRKKTSYLRKNSLIWAFSCCALLIFNVTLVTVYVKKYRTIYVPLEDFTQINNVPIVDFDHDYTQHSFSPSTSVSNPDEHAVVSSLYSDSYVPAVLALVYSIKVANITARPILIYVPEQVSSESLRLVEAAGWTLHPVPLISPPHGGDGVPDCFKDQYTKLNIWTLDTIGIKSLVYLDADTLVRKNFAELFSLPFNFAAVGDVFDENDHTGFRISMNAGVLFVRPSSTIFNDMISKMETAQYPPGYAEQAFLNVYFGTQAVRLPYVYNANLAIKQRSPGFWAALKDEIRIIHYTVDKPFPRVSLTPLELQAFFEERKLMKNGLWAEEMEWWQSAWNNSSNGSVQEVN